MLNKKIKFIILFIPIILFFVWFFSDGIFFLTDGIRTYYIWLDFQKAINKNNDIKVFNFELSNGSGDMQFNGDWDPYFGDFKVNYKDLYFFEFWIFGGSTKSLDKYKLGQNTIGLKMIKDLKNNKIYYFKTHDTYSKKDLNPFLMDIYYNEKIINLDRKYDNLYNFILNINKYYNDILKQIK